MKKKALVVHSGGMDSSICLTQALREFGAQNVLSLCFSYQQRHSIEIARAQRISEVWGVDHTVLDISCLAEITENSLTRHSMKINHEKNHFPNSLVVGRNGLMARIAGIHANHLGAHVIYMGVIEVDSDNSGYRDCSRKYMDLMQAILRIDFADESFEIRTPLVKMTKVETMELANELGVLRFLLENTVTCYNGIEKLGCQACPSCDLRNRGLKTYVERHPEFEFSYRHQI